MTDMLEMIRTLGSQLRWVADIEVPDVASNLDFVVAGMGGSGIGGDYAEAIFHDTPVGIYAHKGYPPLPGWVERVRPALLGVSYSGNTEETLGVVDHAHSGGLDVVSVTTGGALRSRSHDNGWPTIEVPGGLQPRAALGYLFGSVLRLIGEASGISDFRRDLHEAADLADEVTAEGSEGWARAERIAEQLAGRVVVVYGGGALSGAAAQRWKTQINENAKVPAWWSVLPELDHNEIVGWETLSGITSDNVGIVGLVDEGDHERVSDRYRHTRRLTEEAVPWVDIVDSTGSSAVARLIVLTVLGDLVSWMLAMNAGVDPVPVGTIEELKELLVEEDR